MSTEVEAYVGKNVTLSIAGITVAQGTDARVRYEKDRYEIPPLGQEEVVQRGGHRRIRWEINGAEIAPYAWALAIGHKDPNQGQSDLQKLVNAGTAGGYPITTTTVTTFMNKYEGIDFVLEMEDKLTSKRQIFTLSNNLVTVMQLDTPKGFAMYRMTAYATDISIDYQDTSAE